MSDTRASDSLRRGIETAKAGNKLLARLHLLQAVELAPSDPDCWLWLAWVAESPASAKHSLERILEDYPDHELAQLGLRWSQAMADYEYQDGNHLPKKSQTTTVREPLEREFQTESQAGEPEESRQTTPEKEQPREEKLPEAEPSKTREPEPSSFSFGETEQTRSETGFSFEDTGTRWEASSLLNEVVKEPPSLPEPQAAEAAEAEKESVESNASDETLTESSWWRSKSTPSPVPSETEKETTSPSSKDGRPGDTWTEDTPAGEPMQIVPEPIAEAVKPRNRFEARPAPVAPQKVEEPPQLERIVEEAGDEDDFQAEEEESDFGISVLVVDDSPTVRKLVTMTMEKAGLTVGTAPDGVVALKSIAELKPRLILLDITMPRLGGYQLCKLIKKHESTKHIPVIMLSGKDGMFDKVRGKFVGCDDYVTKPFDPDVLVEKVMAQLTEKYGVTATRS